MRHMLNELQMEALREHMNVYIGQAASLLSDMLGKKILLTTPEVVLLSKTREDRATYEKMKPSFFKSHVVASTLHFGTVFSGNAQLVFPQDKSQWLVRLCLGEVSDTDAMLSAMPSSQEWEELTDTDFDAIREIGNVILNAVVGAMGNLLDVKLEYSLPEVHAFYFPEKEEDIFLGDTTHVLVICNTFSVDEFMIEGAILVVLELASVLDLVHKIDEMLVSVDEPTV